MATWQVPLKSCEKFCESQIKSQRISLTAANEARKPQDKDKSKQRGNQG